MRSLSNETKTALSTPVREFKARVEVHRNSTLIGTYTQADAIQKAVIERIAEDGRFFGIGVCQKLKLTLVDKDRTFEIKKNDKLRISIGISSNSAVSETSAIAGKAIVGKAIVGTGEIQKVIDYIEFPSFYVEEVVYDDVSKQVSIEAYDVINKLKYYTVDDLGLTPPYSNKSFMLACAQKVGTVISMSDSYSTNYTNGGNFYGNENLRTAFDAAAESAGCVYYVNDNDVIKVQPINTEKGITIDGSNYFEATKADNYQINEVVSITELGDNTTYQTSREGVKANVYENAFFTNSDDLSANLQKVYNAISEISLDQYSLDWRGNLALEPFDEIKITTTRYGTITSTVSNDVITYDGGLSETTSWTYKETETADATLSTVISKTSAKVDKVNNTITLVAKSVQDLEKNYSELKLTTDSISSTVSAHDGRITTVEQTASGLQTQIKNNSDNITEIIADINGLRTTVNGKIDSTEAQSIFDQSAQGFSLSATSGDSGTNFTLSYDGAQISSSGNLDLHVKAVNISGTVKANQIQTSSIYVGDLADGSSYATKTYVQNNAGLSASEVDDAIATYIDGTSITAESLRGRTVDLLASATRSIGSIELVYTSTGYGMSINTDYGGVQISSGGNVYITSKYNTRLQLDQDAAKIGPRVWATNGTIIYDSDRNVKNSIDYDLSRYRQFLLDLKPCRFKYNEGQSGRYHIGMIAQDVEQSLYDNGIDSTEFSGWCKAPIRDEEHNIVGYTYGLRYDAIIPLNTMMIQELVKRVDALETKLKE